MNKDQVKGAAKEIAGKAQRKLGDAVDSPKHEAKGMAREAEGKLQKTVGDAREAAKDDAARRRDLRKP
jgi:uncharacterized protein YjbJ (UPF0337 family)